MKGARVICDKCHEEIRQGVYLRVSHRQRGPDGDGEAEGGGEGRALPPDRHYHAECWRQMMEVD